MERAATNRSRDFFGRGGSRPERAERVEAANPVSRFMLSIGGVTRSSLRWGGISRSTYVVRNVNVVTPPKSTKVPRLSSRGAPQDEEKQQQR